MGKLHGLQWNCKGYRPIEIWKDPEMTKVGTFKKKKEEKIRVKSQFYLFIYWLILKPLCKELTRMVLRFAVAAHRVQALLISGLSNNPAASQSVHLAHRLLISCLTCCLFGSINQSLHLGMRRPKFCRKLMIFFKIQTDLGSRIKPEHNRWAKRKEHRGISFSGNLIPKCNLHLLPTTTEFF